MVEDRPMPEQEARKPDFSKVIRPDGFIRDVNVFTRMLSETGLYWLVLSKAFEWDFVVCRIADAFIGKDRPVPDPRTFIDGEPEDFPDFGQMEIPDGVLTFFRKSKVPVGELAFRFGAEEGRFEEAKLIELSPTKEMADDSLPAPTIPEALFSTALH